MRPLPSHAGYTGAGGAAAALPGPPPDSTEEQQRQQQPQQPQQQQHQASAASSHLVALGSQAYSKGTGAKAASWVLQVGLVVGPPPNPDATEPRSGGGPAAPPGAPVGAGPGLAACKVLSIEDTEQAPVGAALQAALMRGGGRVHGATGAWLQANKPCVRLRLPHVVRMAHACNLQQLVVSCLGGSERRLGAAWRLPRPWLHSVADRHRPCWCEDARPTSPCLSHLLFLSVDTFLPRLMPPFWTRQVA